MVGEVARRLKGGHLRQGWWRQALPRAVNDGEVPTPIVDILTTFLTAQDKAASLRVEVRGRSEKPHRSA